MITAYFAYGSNMNPERVRDRGLRFNRISAGRLDGFQLVFDKRAAGTLRSGHANIRFAREQSVQGVLYELASSAEILKMDPFERAPVNYGRDAVRIVTAAGTRWAWTYIANAAVRAPDLLPTAEYLSHLLVGAPYLAVDYLERLRVHLCAERAKPCAERAKPCAERAKPGAGLDG